MKLDCSLSECGNYPDWLIYTEATMKGHDNEGTGIIRMASPIQGQWIQDHMKILKKIDLEKLCGKEPTKSKVGQKREAPEELKDESELKKQKLLELKQRFENRKKK